MYLAEFRKLMPLAMPLVLANVAQNTLSFVDTMMAGRLGDDALAGIAIGGTLFHFIQFMFAGVLFAVSPLISQAVGANEHEKIPRLVRQGFWFAALSFIPAFIFYWNAAPVLRLLGQDPQVVESSSGYMKAISFGMLPALMTISLRGLLEGISDTRPILVFSLIGLGLNVFLNDTLMFGRYGFPELGLIGTGVASSIVFTIIFLMTAAYVAITKSEYGVFRQLRQPDFGILRELLAVGVPIAATIMFESSMFAATAFAMGVIGDKQLAAHQIALQTATITFMVPLGLSIATTVRVGMFDGAGDRARARVAGRVGMISSVAVMCVSAVFYLLFPKLIVSIFLDVNDPENEATVNFAITFLRIAGLFQVFDGLQVAASNSLRGLKQTRVAMIVSLVAYWAIGIPACALLAFQLGFGGTGLWYGMTIGLAAAAIAMAWRFELEFRRR